MHYQLHGVEDERTDPASHVSHWFARRVSFPTLFGESYWQPSVNLYEDESAFYVVADLAGMKAQDVGVHVEDQVLTLSGQRVSPQPSEIHGSLRVHIMEIDHGQFLRRMALPPDVEVEKIKASYRYGFLWIRLPKKA